MGLFDSIFSGGREGAARAMRRGQEAGMQEARSAFADEQGFVNPNLPAFGGMTAQEAMLDPNKFYSNIMGGYEMSPAARRQMGEEQEAIRNAAAASGMSGSTDAAMMAGRAARDFSADDMQRYYQNQMGIFNQGLGRGDRLASFRDLMGQRLQQGQIGIGQANAMQQLGRGAGLQSALGTALYGLQGLSGGFQAPQQGGGSQGLMTLAQLLGGM